MSERLILSRVDGVKLAAELKSAGVECHGHEAGELVSLAKLLGGQGDRFEQWTEMPSLPPEILGFLVPKTYYNVNVSRAALTLAATLLDAAGALGLANATLSISGLSSRAVAPLDPNKGEYCALVHAQKLSAEKADVSPVTVAALTSDKVCPFPKVGCTHMRGQTCCADHQSFENLFISLKEKGALEKYRDSWRVPL